jgi:serine/threonine protein kinase
MDLRALIHPKEESWKKSGLTWLLDIYDWDFVIVEQDAVIELSFGLNLCVAFFPCSMQIKGSPFGVIRRRGSGYISCYSSDGCVTLRLDHIKFFCEKVKPQNSIFKIQGSNLAIFNSSFASCGSSEDGGVIQSFDKSTVVVNLSNFSESYSSGFGGAISAYGGSLHVFGSSFYDAHASRGGGAIRVAAYESFYGYLKHHNTRVEIAGSIFANCTTDGDGGAILVSDALNSGSRNKLMNVTVQFSTLSSCKSSGFGGALSFSGYSVVARLISCALHCNIASECGGAISGHNSVIYLLDSVLNNNSALGFGGGALFLKETLVFAKGTSCFGNRAPAGGGGVLLNQGPRPPPTEDIAHLCSLDNSAKYGSCMASECKSLNLSYESSGLFWSGIPFKIAITKLDAYQQIIVADSSTFLQILPSESNMTPVENSKSFFQFVGSTVSQFSQGIAHIELAIKPNFVQIKANEGLALIKTQPHIFIQSSDMQTGLMIKSNVASIKLEEGRHVCPRGYVLDLDSQFTELRLPALGACKLCKYGTYSLDPLVGSNNKIPACMTCPSGVKCLEGGSIQYELGNWTPTNGVLHLIDCPAGYSLRSTVFAGSSELQEECQPCLKSQYSIMGSCFNCPIGALCPDGACVFLRSLSNRICAGETGVDILGEWILDNSSKDFLLYGCPAGYSISSQKCDLCPAAFYCAGNNLPSRPCASGRFTPPGANSSAACVPSVFVTITVNLRIKKPEFRDFQALQFQNALANITHYAPGYVFIKLIQSGHDPETTTVASDIATPGAKEAAALVDLVNSGQLSVGLTSNPAYYHVISLISVRTTSCVPGYELDPQTSVCKQCPATYFCVGGTLGRETCPTERGFSIPGANETTSCIPAVIVYLTFSIPIILEDISDAVLSKMISAISVAASLSFERIAVDQNFRRARRAESPASVTVTTMLAAKDSDSALVIRKKIEANLDIQFLAQGLPKCTYVSIRIPQIASDPDSGPNIPLLIILVILGISILSALCFGFPRLELYLDERECARISAALRSAILSANSGDVASEKHLPPTGIGQPSYTPERILSGCNHGGKCVVLAKDISKNVLVAIKLKIHPSQEYKPEEMKREGQMLQLLSSRKSEFTSRLYSSYDSCNFVGGRGVFVSWCVMELIRGERMDDVIYSRKGADAESTQNAVDEVECICAARDVLAALKFVHSVAMLHLNVQPSNILRCDIDSTRRGFGGVEKESGHFAYKLIGFSNVCHIADTEAKQSLTNTAGTQSMGPVTSSYMPPEIFTEPGNATYSADVWSTGIAMFELLTGTLPFHAISGVMEAKAPSVLERLNNERRSELLHSLASVIAKSVEKNPVKRYASADEMHQAVFTCLVMNGKACYTVFLTYRAESDAPLARLLFDMLNHSFTPGGHRVAVYMDIGSGHALNANWDADIADGLLHSVCFLPILSYGATAPLAALPVHEISGWEETPLGLVRLSGAEQDREDALLKEMLIALVLLERASDADAAALLDEERGQLCTAMPVFVGQLHPESHTEYPHMGKYLDIQGGGGQYSKLPSPSTNQAAVRFLRDRAGLPVEAVKRFEDFGVASVVKYFDKMDGCQLWDHASDLAEAPLTVEQKALVGSKGNSDSQVILHDSVLCTEQVASPQQS